MTNGKLASTALVLALTGLTGGCATRTASGEGEVGADRVSTGAATQVVTREQILDGSASNAWEALRDHVRYIFWREDAGGNATMATRRGNTSMQGPENVRVMVDHAEINDINDLRMIPVQHLEEIRVLSAVDATTYFGTNSGSGAVLILTRR